MGMKKFGLVAATAVAAGAVLVPAAQAVTVGAGDGYYIGGDREAVARCSVNSVYEVDGEKYMLTAGHCFNYGAMDGALTPADGTRTVYSGEDQTDRIGVIVAENTVLEGTIDGQEGPVTDWTVVKLDPDVELRTGTVHSKAHGVTGLLPVLEEATGVDLVPQSPDMPLDGTVSHAVAGENVYRDGNTSGRTGGMVLTSDDREATVVTWGIPGDSGGVLHDGKGTNLGITSRSAVYLPLSMYAHTDVNVREAQENPDVPTLVSDDQFVAPEDRDVSYWGGDFGAQWNEAQGNSTANQVAGQVTGAVVDTAWAADDALVDLNTATGGGVDQAVDNVNHAADQATAAVAQYNQVKSDVDAAVAGVTAGLPNVPATW